MCDGRTHSILSISVSGDKDGTGSGGGRTQVAVAIIGGAALLGAALITGVFTSASHDRNLSTGGSAASPPAMTPPAATASNNEASPAALSSCQSIGPPPVTVRERPLTVQYCVNPKLEDPPAVDRLVLTKGDVIAITAKEGAWRCITDPPYEKPVSLEGNSSYRAEIMNSFRVPGRNLCTLIGKVGTSGTWRDIGQSLTMTADTSGPLYLTANDLSTERCSQMPEGSCYEDNEGGVLINIVLVQSRT